MGHLIKCAHFQELSRKDSGPCLIRQWIPRQNDVRRRYRGNREVGWVQSDGSEVWEAVRRRFFFTTREKQVEALDFDQNSRLSLSLSFCRTVSSWLEKLVGGKEP